MMLLVTSVYISYILLQNLPYCYSHRPITGDIREIINQREVERIIAQRKLEAEQSDKKYLIENDLVEGIKSDHQYEYKRFNSLDEDMDDIDHDHIELDVLLRKSNMTTDPFKIPDLLSDVRGYKGSKLLKSSRNALVVTQKNYLRKDWCKTEPLLQKIKEAGCLPRTVINRFCYGQCNSFYIPKNPKQRRSRRRKISTVGETEDEDLNGAAFKSCAFCKPKKFTWITVTLKCPNSTPMFRKKRLQRIKECKCIATNVD